MVSTRQYRALLLVAVGLALVFNGGWLLPQEGEPLYTYERSEVTVENGTLEYWRPDDDRADQFNDLPFVDCRWPEDDLTSRRVCAFDQRLARHGPITVADPPAYRTETEFVRIDGRYYERTANSTHGGFVYDVKRVAPGDILAEESGYGNNLSHVSPSEAADLNSIPVSVVVTGQAESTTEEPTAERVGEVYRYNDTYYALIVADVGEVDWPVFEPWIRGLVLLLGIVSFATGFVVGGGETLVRLVRRLPPHD